MKTSLKTLAALLALAFAAHAGAAPTADEIKSLGTTLTAVGAERAGNKDGTIPEYKGGLTTPPAGFKAGDGIRPNPFANEKPRLSIDAKNMAQHADKLTEGTKAMLQKYPTFRVDVYPTQRTVALPASRSRSRRPATRRCGTTWCASTARPTRASTAT